MANDTVVTVTISIGNSDDKLGQKRWAEYCYEVKKVVALSGVVLEFAGHSPSDAEWQTATWVFRTKRQLLNLLKPQLVEIRKKFNQDSLSVTVGKTQCI